MNTLHPNPEMHIKHNPLPSAGVIPTCIFRAKTFGYSSCLFVAWTVTVGGKIMK